jgi:hypothetical protein
MPYETPHPLKRAIDVWNAGDYYWNAAEPQPPRRRRTGRRSAERRHDGPPL